MSIETLGTAITISEESEESVLAISEESEKSILEWRTRLHREIAVFRLRIHELETRHRTLTMGLIALSSKFNASTSEADINVHIGLTDERDELADTIHLLREEEGYLVEEISACNNNIVRERPEKFSGNKHWEEKRRAEELPYTIQIHNEGVDHREILALPFDELDSPNDRYLKNAVQ